MTKMDEGLAAAPMTADVDHDFATMMMPDQEGAIDIANAKLADEPWPQQETLTLTLTLTYKRETNDALLSDSRTPDRLCGVRSCPNRRPRPHSRPDLV
jgi:hypothetical protein